MSDRYRDWLSAKEQAELAWCDDRLGVAVRTCREVGAPVDPVTILRAARLDLHPQRKYLLARVEALARRKVNKGNAIRRAV